MLTAADLQIETRPFFFRPYSDSPSPALARHCLHMGIPACFEGRVGRETEIKILGSLRVHGGVGQQKDAGEGGSVGGVVLAFQ
jgi:hypothetical protein